MVIITVPLEFAIHVAEVVSDFVDLTVHTIVAIVAVVDVVAHALELIANAIEFFTHVAAAVAVGFIAQVAIPFPEAAYVGAKIVVGAIMIVMIAGLDDWRDGKQTGDDAESE